MNVPNESTTEERLDCPNTRSVAIIINAPIATLMKEDSALTMLSMSLRVLIRLVRFSKTEMAN